jgi:hypothetical protein
MADNTFRRTLARLVQFHGRTADGRVKVYSRDIPPVSDTDAATLAHWRECAEAVIVTVGLRSDEARVVWALNLTQIERLAPHLRMLVGAGHRFEWSPNAIAMANAWAEGTADELAAVEREM